MSNIWQCGYGGTTADVNLAFDSGYGITSGNGTTSKIVVTSTGWAVTGTMSVSGVQTFANGTAAAPSIAFTNSTGTGFYRASADVLGIALAGVAGLVVAGSAPSVAAAKVWTPDTDIVPVTAHPVDVTTIFEVVPLPLVMP
jgi:hypothetical protein